MHDGDPVLRLFEPEPDEHAPSFVVVCDRPTARLQYTCDFIFGRVLGCGHRIGTETVTPAEGEVVINYNHHELPEAFRIRPQGLLSETGIADRKPEPYFRDGQIYFFPSGEGHSGLHFDLFAAVFYFISRMEEWQPFTPDTHGRFEAASSLLFAHNRHLQPVVDQWIKEFTREVRKHFPRVTFRAPRLRVVSTLDVDNLYAYRSKGLVRTLGGAARDLLRFDFAGFAERLAVVSGLRKDPFDIYRQVCAFSSANQLPLVWFFLMRAGKKYDRTIDPARGLFGPVMGEIRRQGHHLGLHPSYDAGFDSALLAEEAGVFAAANGETVRRSRQHFLRFDIRSTPHLLMRQGIRADFTMGFASAGGFRAGTSHPFHYYDLQDDRKHDLLMVPFCAMDGAYTVYGDRDARAALVELLAIAETIRLSGGFFVSVFHERTFSNRLYRGYGSLYKNLHERLAELARR